MYTGNFALLGKNKLGAKAIGIARGKPRFVKVQSYDKLAPSWELLRPFKDGIITEDQYIIGYNEQLSALDPRAVYNELRDLAGGDDFVIMCYCGKDSFCHRFIVAEWLIKNLGIEISEFGVKGKTLYEKGRMKKIEDQLNLI